MVASAQERAQRLHAEVSMVADVQPENPVNALVRESHEAALVVVGSHGRGRITGMLLDAIRGADRQPTGAERAMSLAFSRGHFFSRDPASFPFCTGPCP
ncbi:universal stress protein [Streptomyces sp. NPDC058092]|uniref:universal stress protein n=1 Tax=Streptomyces sp. NPDC058092 TaxID=3346336 RepID=UPI0036E88163